MTKRVSYVTENRKKILQLLEDEKDKTFTISEIEQALYEANIQINPSTIYRYIDKLVQEGTVLKYVAQKGEKAIFQYVGGKPMCHEHLHMKCKQCGTIIHLDCDFMDEITHHIESEHAFWLECKSSILYGLCEKCK